MPVRIADVLVAEVLGGYFYDDQEAIRRGAVRDGERYVGVPVTPGFSAVRMPAAAIGIGLRLDSGMTAWGDGMSVQYAAAGGRDPVMAPAALAPAVREHGAPALRGLELTGFRAGAAAVIEALRRRGLAHRGLDYAVSQAVLGAIAAEQRRTMAEVLCAEYGLPVVAEAVPVYAQSGDRRHQSVDTMIAKRVDVLPHALINAPEKIGPGAEALLAYVAWLRKRILETAPPTYRPVLHVDVYGMLGRVLGDDLDAVARALVRLGETAAPFRLTVEGPVDAGSRVGQLRAMTALRERLDGLGTDVRIAADEWCNTLEDIIEFARSGAGHVLQVKVPDLGSLDHAMKAVLACRQHDTEVFLGGSCTETDLSARACVHLAVAARPAFQLAKPGMGVDEALMIVGNEQRRLLAELRARRSPPVY